MNSYFPFCAVLCDMDETLSRSSHVHVDIGGKIIEDLFAAEGLKLHDYQEHFGFFPGRSYPDTHTVLADVYKSLTAKDLPVTYEQYIGQITEKFINTVTDRPSLIQWIDGAKEGLSWLGNQNIPVALITNSEEPFKEATAGALNLHAYIPPEWQCCITDVGLQNGKPKSDLIQLAIAKAQQDTRKPFENVLVIGDSTADLKASIHANENPQVQAVVSCYILPTIHEQYDVSRKIVADSGNPNLYRVFPVGTRMDTIFQSSAVIRPIMEIVHP